MSEVIQQKDEFFDILASDVSGLGKAPDLRFFLAQDRASMWAKHAGWSVTCSLLEDDRTLIVIELDALPYCRAVHVPTISPHFAEENQTAEVACFAAGLFWSAWRRKELDNQSGSVVDAADLLAAKDARISELELALKEILATNMDLRCTYCGDRVHSVPISKFEGRSTYDEAREAIKAHDLACPKSPFLARIAELERRFSDVAERLAERNAELVAVARHLRDADDYLAALTAERDTALKRVAELEAERDAPGAEQMAEAFREQEQAWRAPEINAEADAAIGRHLSALESAPEPMNPYPTLTALLGPQLEEMERVCALGQSGKYSGKSIYDRTADHHFDRAQSHALAGTVDLDELDADTGASHLLLAALRLMMATACVEREGERDRRLAVIDGRAVEAADFDPPGREHTAGDALGLRRDR